jgi:hypothetical protein
MNFPSFFGMWSSSETFVRTLEIHPLYSKRSYIQKQITLLYCIHQERKKKGCLNLEREQQNFPNSALPT